MTAAVIDVAQRGRATVVTLRRPPADAMDLDLTEEIAAVFKRLPQDQARGAVVFTGQEKSFCAGVDLKAVPNLDEADQQRMVNALNSAFHAVYSCPVPVVGAINRQAIAK